MELGTTQPFASPEEALAHYGKKVTSEDILKQANKVKLPKR